MYKVIDDFYPESDKIREFALNCSFEKTVSAKWNGLRSVEKHPNTKQVLFKIADSLNLDSKPNWNQIEISDNFWQRASVGAFTTLYEKQFDTIHFHYFTGRWSGVCYLTPPELCKGRTALTFYRNVKRNIETVYSLEKKDIVELKEETSNEDLWEKTNEIEMKYNRMIVFDGQYFHKASNGFGTAPDNCRLTQLFGFNI